MPKILISPELLSTSSTDDEPESLQLQATTVPMPWANDNKRDAQEQADLYNLSMKFFPGKDGKSKAVFSGKVIDVLRLVAAYEDSNGDQASIHDLVKYIKK